MGPRDDVHGDQFAHAARGGSAGIGGRFHGSHIAADHRGDVAGTYLLPADERDLGRFHHRVRGLDHRNHAARFDHTECFAHSGSSGNHF